MITTPDINYQKDYWDSLARDRVFTHPLNLEKINSIITPEHRILDYGCGYGRLCQFLWDKGFKNILGIDFSPKMIARGKRLFPHLDLKTVDFDFQFIKSDSFDLVLLFSVLTCIPSDIAVQNLINQIQSLLSPGGYLYISDTAIQTSRRNVNRYKQFQQEFGRYGVFRLADGGIFRHFNIAEIEQFTSEFEQISIDFLQVRTMNNHPAQGFQYLCRIMG